MFDATRLAITSAVFAWIGATLLLSNLRWFSRVSLTDRLLPFSATRTSALRTPLATFRDALAPLSAVAGEQLSRLFGVQEDLETRLRRARSNETVSAFRLRQAGRAACALAAALLLAVAVRPPVLVSLFSLAGAPLLAFLLIEQQLIQITESRKKRIFSELPVVAEQLAMLLGAGYSLGSALNRVADRSQGICADDLRDVCERVRHGLTTATALREWAELSGVPEVHRLVAVLALSTETSDLGRLVSEEAKGIRREAQRRLAETIDKRAQQVWIPVTVATLVPGVTFLIIPFLQALQLFSGT